MHLALAQEPAEAEIVIYRPVFYLLNQVQKAHTDGCIACALY